MEDDTARMQIPHRNNQRKMVHIQRSFTPSTALEDLSHEVEQIVPSYNRAVPRRFLHRPNLDCTCLTNPGTRKTERLGQSTTKQNLKAPSWNKRGKAKKEKGANHDNDTRWWIVSHCNAQDSPPM
jgi:hypothetical protein